MSTNVNEAVTTWNAEHATATVELETLEATLKADFNKYVDSLAAYVGRLKSANDVRQGFVCILSIEDVSNDTRTADAFGYNAELPIENNAVKYLLDTNNDAETKSPTFVRACASENLLSRKAV
jgi:hypothetical protein